MNNLHNANSYLNIVKHFINIGHVHSFSNFSNIIAQGSFDRLSHGEEEAKGAVVCILSRDGENRFEFIENKHAKKFITIELKQTNMEKSMRKIEKILAKLPMDSHVRIKARKDHPVYNAMEELKKKYNEFIFSKVSIEAEEELQSTSSLINDDFYTPITITPDNILEILTKEITNKHQLTNHSLDLINEIIEANR